VATMLTVAATPISIAKQIVSCAISFLMFIVFLLRS
jgi:hypothetical protein